MSRWWEEYGIIVYRYTKPPDLEDYNADGERYGLIPASSSQHRESSHLWSGLTQCLFVWQCLLDCRSVCPIINVRTSVYWKHKVIYIQSCHLQPLAYQADKIGTLWFVSVSPCVSSSPLWMFDRLARTHGYQLNLYVLAFCVGKSTFMTCSSCNPFCTNSCTLRWSDSCLCSWNASLVLLLA